MFDLLIKKLHITSTQPTQIPRQYPLASDMTDDELIAVLMNVFDDNRPVISSLFLVALVVFPAQYAFFLRDMRKSHQYALSMDSMIGFILDMHARYQGDDLNSEISSRKWYFLYIAGLLNIAQERAEHNPELWQPIAEIWVRLINAAKNLRATLLSTCIWQPDETFLFNMLEEDDDDIVNFFEGAVLPAQLRLHPLVLEWKQRNVQFVLMEEQKIFDY